MNRKTISYLVLGIVIVSCLAFLSYNVGYVKGVDSGEIRIDESEGFIGFKFDALDYYLDGDKVTDVLEYPFEASSYVIFNLGSTVYAKNGKTGDIDYYGANVTTVIQSALDSLTASRNWKEQVVICGSYDVDSTISIPSYTTVKSNAYFERTHSGPIFQVLGTSPSWLSNVDIIGGTFNGSKQVYPSSQDPVILIDYIEHIKISDVHIYDCSWWGVCSKQPVSVRWSELTDSYCENSCGLINMNMDEYFVWSNNHAKNNDIDLRTTGSKHGTIEGNVITGGVGGGITVMGGSTHVTVVGNQISHKDKEGIEFAHASDCIATGNELYRNRRGGFKNWWMSNCTIEGNLLVDNFWADPDPVESPIAAQLSTFSVETFTPSSNNVIKDNTFICSGEGNPDPDYAIGEFVDNPGVDGDIDYNTYVGNTFIGEHDVAYVSFIGENNIYERITQSITWGTTSTNSGFEIDQSGEQCTSFLYLPSDVQQLLSLKVYARSAIACTDTMAIELVIRGGSDNETFSTHTRQLLNFTSTSSNFAQYDIIHWSTSDSQILQLSAYDSIELILIYNIGGGPNDPTDADFRTVIFEYV